MILYSFMEAFIDVVIYCFAMEKNKWNSNLSASLSYMVGDILQ